MSKPEDNPQDVWDACAALAAEPRVVGEFFQKNYIEPIARLVLAERQRCAKIVYDAADDVVEDSQFAAGILLSAHSVILGEAQ